MVDGDPFPPLFVAGARSIKQRDVAAGERTKGQGSQIG